MEPIIKSLNDQFGINQIIQIISGPGNLTAIKINNQHAIATIILQGAHVLEYQPLDQEPILWHSKQSIFQPNIPIRGGIPICWPWFANHPIDESKPMHGFARTANWQITNTSHDQNNQSHIELQLTHTENSLSLWPHQFNLKYNITIGPSLQLQLTTENTSPNPFQISEALHTYFNIHQINHIEISGLDQTHYIDKTDNFKSKLHTGQLKISKETDAMFLNTTNTCHILDPDFKRMISIAKQNSQSTVVWNPWLNKAAAMKDFGDDEYPQMLCIESANVDQNTLTINPGDSHTLQAIISTSTL